MSETRIEIVSGPMDGQEFALSKDEFSLGRSETNDISLPLDAGVIADSHLALSVVKSGGLQAQNNSSEPFSVDGEDVQDRAELDEGQVIRVGRTELMVTQLKGGPTGKKKTGGPAPPAGGVKVCPRAQCQAVNAAANRYCQKCGAPLDTS